MSRKSPPWYKRYPVDFRADTRQLTLEVRGAYNDILDLIYIADGPIPDDDHIIAHQLMVHVLKWKPIKADLIERGMLVAKDGKLHNPKAEKVLAERHAKQEEKAARARGDGTNAGQTQGGTPATTPGGSPPSTPGGTQGGTGRGFEELPNEINDGRYKTGLYACARERGEDRDRESSTDRESSVTPTPRLFSNDEMGDRVIANGVAFKWLDPENGEQRHLKFDFLKSLLPEEPFDSVKAFAHCELIGAVGQGKKGDLSRWIRAGIGERYARWSQQQRAAKAVQNPGLADYQRKLHAIVGAR